MLIGYSEWTSNYNEKVELADTNMTLYLNTTGEIECCYAHGYLFAWFKDGIVLRQSSLYRNVNSSSLIIENVQTSDKGLYSCITNDYDDYHVYINIESKHVHVPEFH